MKSRKKFVEQVANNIKRNHASEDDSSFIFGISGKWGEGKTTFLKDLEDNLQTGDFRVIWINPWKYGDDKIALLRNFLLAMKPETQQIRLLIGNITHWLKETFGKETANDNEPEKYSVKKNVKIIWRQFRRNLNDKKVSKELLHDRNKISIHFGLAVFLVLAVVNVLLWSLFLKGQLENMPLDLYQKYLLKYLLFYERYERILNYVLISLVFPVVYTIGKMLLTTQVGSKSVQTIDQFDELLNKVLADEPGKRVVVFVDDLDRVTPEIARNVLDNLRVFFNRSNISFVVAGDHTVLERYIGSQTYQIGKPNEQLEEGRRYLKKIFNVYWRLPLPVKSEFDSALEELIEKNDRKLSLKKVFTKDSEYKQFISYLDKYFERNFRAIERFVERIIFTFEAIEIQFEESNDDGYMQNLKEFPLLVIRILLIEEFCAPLFEKIARKIAILDELEMEASYRKDVSKFKTILNEHGAELTDYQKNIITRIMFDNQGFIDSEGNILVKSYQPFVHLASDSSFGNVRGLLPEKFVSILKSGDMDRVKEALVTGGVQKLQEAAESSVKHINSQVGDITTCTANTLTLVNALSSLDGDHRSQNIFMNKMVNITMDQIIPKISPHKERIKFYLPFWAWLDSINNYTEQWLDIFPLIHNDDFDFVEPKEGLDLYGKFTSRMLGKWFNKNYITQKLKMLEKIDKHIDLLDIGVFKSEISSIADDIINDFIASASEVERNMRLKIVEKFSNEEQQQKLVNYIYSKVNEQDELVTTWTIGKGSATELWTVDDIQLKIINLIDNCTSYGEFVRLLTFSRAKITTKKSGFWIKALNEKASIVLESIPHIHSDISFQSLSPSKEISEKIFLMIVEKAKITEDLEQKLNWLSFLVKQKWLWSSLDKMPAGKKLNGMQRSKEARVKQQIEAIKTSWQG